MSKAGTPQSFVRSALGVRRCFSTASRRGLHPLPDSERAEHLTQVKRVWHSHGRLCHTGTRRRRVAPSWESIASEFTQAPMSSGAAQFPADFYLDTCERLTPRGVPTKIFHLTSGQHCDILWASEPLYVSAEERRATHRKPEAALASKPSGAGTRLRPPQGCGTAGLTSRVFPR